MTIMGRTEWEPPPESVEPCAGGCAGAHWWNKPTPDKPYTVPRWCESNGPDPFSQPPGPERRERTAGSVDIEYYRPKWETYP